MDAPNQLTVVTADERRRISDVAKRLALHKGWGRSQLGTLQVYPAPDGSFTVVVGSFSFPVRKLRSAPALGAIMGVDGLTCRDAVDYLRGWENGQ